jgi:hypothetical protein
MRLTTNFVCASCQLEEEMPLHFVFVCPTLATLRTRIFGKPIMNAGNAHESNKKKVSNYKKHECNFKTSTRTRVITTHKVQFPPAEWDFHTHECDFHTNECNVDTYECDCDYDTLECDFYTQNDVISTRTRFVSTRRVR